MARPAMSMPMPLETAQAMELRKKIATAIKSTGLRPQMSDIFAQIVVLAALASKYAPPIHVYPAAL